MIKKNFALFLLGLVCCLCYGFLTLFGPKDSLEKKIYFSASESRLFYASLSAEEVRNYQLSSVIDLLFIAFYSGFFSILSLRSPTLKVLAPLAGIFDFIETVSIVAYLSQFVSVDFVIYLGPVTSSKWIALVLFLSSYLFHLHRPTRN
jgi:hypothetical protein